MTQFGRSRLLHAAACRSDCWNERWDPCDIPFFVKDRWLGCGKTSQEGRSDPLGFENSATTYPGVPGWFCSSGILVPRYRGRLDLRVVEDASWVAPTMQNTVSFTSFTLCFSCTVLYGSPIVPSHGLSVGISMKKVHSDCPRASDARDETSAEWCAWEFPQSNHTRCAVSGVMWVVKLTPRWVGVGVLVSCCCCCCSWWWWWGGDGCWRCFFPLQLLVGSKAANLLAVDYIVNLSVALTSRLKVRMRGWRKA